MKRIIWILPVFALAAALPLPSYADKQAAQQTAYIQTNLVFGLTGTGVIQDPNLLTPWGVTFAPAGPFIVADNGDGRATSYSDDPQPLTTPLIINIASQSASPTGDAFVSVPDEFEITGPNHAGAAVTEPALLVFATQGGTIQGWNPAIDPTGRFDGPGGTSAETVTAIDNSKTGASYTGIAFASTEDCDRLFAANFAQGRIDVFDDEFRPVVLPAGAFTDPDLPGGFVPFNVVTIGGRLYVTYAKVKPRNGEADRGMVDVYDLDGSLALRFKDKEALNQPWGVALAPANFGQFSNDILVGNHGDGLINAYRPDNGRLVGTLQDANGNAVTIDGLFALLFGNGAAAGPTNALFFSATTNQANTGLFGRIDASPVPAPPPK